jgi:hypothetical protein
MSWKAKPSWNILADRANSVHPEFQGFVAKRMGATVFETDSSQVPMLSQPDLVLAVIRKAANVVQARLQTTFGNHLRQRKAHRTCVSEPEEGLGDAKGEGPLHTSAEFVRTYSAIVDALTATVINAQAGLDWLSAQPSNLEEVRRVLNTIADDGKRAGEIVVRLQAPMKETPTAGKALDP